MGSDMRVAGWAYAAGWRELIGAADLAESDYAAGLVRNAGRSAGSRRGLCRAGWQELCGGDRISLQLKY